jgi:predicted AlkP superfamily phosphohydrolase/phosphomutase
MEDDPGRERRPRLLVVGIDSSTWRVLRPLIENGDLPTFRALTEGGAWGTLLSTVPSVTPPGWLSSFTGVNPGKHGVFDFQDYTSYLPDDLGMQMASVSAMSSRAPPFWRLLAEEGLTTGTVNLPMTYPLGNVAGYAIAGFPCGEDEGGLYQPPDLVPQIKETVGSFPHYMEQDLMEEDRPAEYMEALNSSTDAQAKMALELMGSRPTDLVVFAFTECDRVQHYFWNCWDEDHPTHDEDRAAFRHAIRDHYRVIDRNLASMMEAMGPDVPIIVYSDHGANGIHRIVFLNTYLVQQGVMVMKGAKGEEVKGGEKETRERLLDRRRIERTMKRMGMDGMIQKIPKSIRTIFPTVSIETVDWSRTKAYFSSATAHAVTINLKGREPQGCVEPGEEYDRVVGEVIEVLMALRDPETGRCPFTSAHRRTDLWEGPYVDQGPDIVLVPAEGYVAHRHFKEHVFEEIGTGWKDRSGDHEREGILILHGPGIRKGHRLRDRHLEDIAPTVMHLCGAGVPRYMDGGVIQEAFDDDWSGDHPVRPVGDGEFRPIDDERTSMDADEEALLKERLRGLGYMD